MRVIETIDNIDIILKDEKNVEFIGDKALVKLVGIARSGHHFNKEQDRKLNSREFKDLLCSITKDENLIYTLMNRYQNVVLNTDIYALINRDYKEYDLVAKSDVYLDEYLKDKFRVKRAFCTKSIERIGENDFIIKDDTGTFHIKLDGNKITGCKIIGEDFKKTNLPNVLHDNHKLYNLDTMKVSRYYDYIGEFKEYLRKDGSVYNAAHAIKYVTVSENVDSIERTKTSTLDCFIDEEGKIISHVYSSFHNDLLIGGDAYFEEMIEAVTTQSRESLKENEEDKLVKKMCMKRK